MSKNRQIRDVTVGLRIFRDFVLGRKHDRDLRFSWFVATRSPDPPELPAGPHSKLSANYYCTRDARHHVEPPLFIAGPQTVAQIESAESKSKSEKNPVIGLTPGKPYQWDEVDKDAYDPKLKPKITTFKQDKVH